MGRTRTFLAVNPGEVVQRAAMALQEKLSRVAPDVRWADPRSMHVTLLFLGEVDDRDLAALCRIVAKVAATEAPFTMQIQGIGAFPTPRRPKTLWAGITTGAEVLKRLHEKLETPLIELGCYRREDRPYQPHLTLGRVKGEADESMASQFPKYQSWDGGTAAIEELLLYSSELRRDGPEYAIMGRAPLG